MLYYLIIIKVLRGPRAAYFQFHLPCCIHGRDLMSVYHELFQLNFILLYFY